MAANIVSDQDSTPVVARSQTPGPVLYRSPQPRRYFSASRISRRRASSTSALTFNDFNRRALFDEAVRRAHQTPPLDEIPGLEDSLPNSSLVVPEYTVEASAPSLSSSACSTPSAAAFGLYQSSEAITLPSTLPATTFASSAPVFDFSSSFGYNMPGEYSHQYPTYPSGYPSVLSGEYPDEKHSLPADSTEPHQSYSSSYAPSEPAAISTPHMGSRSGSVEADHHSDYHSYPPYTYSTLPIITAPTSSYSYTATTIPPAGLPYAPAESNLYMPYQQHTSFIGSHAGYPPHSQTGTIDPLSTQTERVVDPPKESRCWDHGCNGRAFSTHSNYLRHQREKNGQATKSVCPRCGAMFTRKTAMNGHMLHDKCKRRSGHSTSSERSGGGARDR